MEEVFTLNCWAISFRYASGCCSMYCFSFWGSIFLLWVGRVFLVLGCLFVVFGLASCSRFVVRC